MSLGRRVAEGAVWLLAARIGGQLFGLASTIIVARFVLPDDYGVFAAAMSLMLLISVFAEFPVSQAIVYLPDANDDDYDTAFTINLIRSAAIALLLLLLALPLASFMNDERIGPVTVALSVYMLILGLRNPRLEWFTRKLDFSREAAIEVSSKLAQFLFSAIFAVLLKSYWALLIGVTMSALTQFVLSHFMRPVMPRVTLKSFRRLFSFSIWMAGNSLLSQLYNVIDTLTLGRIAGSATLGTYAIGSLLSGRIAEFISAPATRPLFAAFSQIQSERERLASALVNAMSLIAFFLTPIAITLIVFAEPIIIVVLGSQWTGAIGVVQFTAALTLPLIAWTPLQAVLMGTGRTRLLFVRAAVFVSLYLPFAIWSVAQDGLAGLLHFKLTFILLFALIDITILKQVFGLSYWRQAGAIIRPAIAALAMLIVFTVLGPLVPRGPDFFSIAVPLALICICGGIAYVSAALAAWHLSRRPDGIERKSLQTVAKMVNLLRTRLMKA